MQPKKFLALAVVVGALFASSALAIELRFSEIQMPLGTNSSQVRLFGPEYLAFGIEVENAYRYHDNRDPFSDGAENLGANPFGLSNCNKGNLGCTENNLPARISFTSPVSNLAIDWWTISTNTFFLDVYDTNDSLLFSFSGQGHGTELVAFSDIGYMTWHDSTGFVQVSNIRFDPVPEPGTLLLLGSGIGALSAAARRRRRP